MKYENIGVRDYPEYYLYRSLARFCHSRIRGNPEDWNVDSCFRRNDMGYQK